MFHGVVCPKFAFPWSTSRSELRTQSLACKILKYNGIFDMTFSSANASIQQGSSGSTTLAFISPAFAVASTHG
jgi:hypothetical protein